MNERKKPIDWMRAWFLWSALIAPALILFALLLQITLSILTRGYW